MHRIQRLQALGQDTWLDFIDRKLLLSGDLERLLELGVRGVTSNPTIFQKAIAQSSDYDAFIAAAPPSESNTSILERLMVRDLTLACDLLRGASGFASIEVSPDVANDTGASVEQAVRLWNAVNRPNLMVKIPGTPAGLLAIESAIAHGINVNITLLFSVPRYRQVIEAFLCGLERRVMAKQPIDHIHSVASFFVSRVDTKVDKLLPPKHPLRGRIAIDNAKLAYEDYELIVKTDRWKELASRGAHAQRLLWASTSPKDPAYTDLHYANALIGPDTVDTMTRDTLEAFLDHGDPASRITEDRERARQEMDELGKLGIDFGMVAEELEDEGVASFAKSFQDALKQVDAKRRATHSAA